MDERQAHSFQGKIPQGLWNQVMDIYLQGQHSTKVALVCELIRDGLLYRAYRKKATDAA